MEGNPRTRLLDNARIAELKTVERRGVTNYSYLFTA
jgi:hypothetical protein